jgi:hypothetical protein
MVPQQKKSLGGSGRAHTPETHLDTQPTLEDPARQHFASDEDYQIWLASRNRQCLRDPKLVGDDVSNIRQNVSGISAYLPGDTD